MAAMRYATTLTQFPLGLVATAMSFAILPTLSRYSSGVLDRGGILEPGIREPEEPLIEVTSQESALGNQPSLLAAEPVATEAKSPPSITVQEALTSYKTTLALGMKMMLLVILPAAVGLVVLREPIIRLLFQHGIFDAEATSRTSLAFLCYSPGLPAAAVDQLLIFSFYARKNTVTPVLVGVMGVLVYLLVAATPLGPLTMPRLALANSAQWVSHALVMFFLLRRAVGGLGGFGLGAVVAKALAGSAVMGGALCILTLVIERWVDISRISGLAVYLGLAVGLGIVVYGAIIIVLRVEETRLFWQMIKARMGR